MKKNILRGSGFAEPLNVTICEDNNSISQLSLKSAFAAVAKSIFTERTLNVLGDK